eukprot:TRINITY_DN16590_c0_g2_i1.p1 TRINITY_DN16590_c0_g2~~TRINITY_DN16590_c0_g2_i1.p1  ORF type:complete len:211 (-),score=6.17 TRINITY_DN16590_c0_g2_i1:43-585(-)
MKKGSYLLNASRGSVVVIPDLVDALKSGHLGGAYVDVYPVEPEESVTDGFETPLRGLKNVLLTPHIGGSTIEAQAAIAAEVSNKLLSYLNEGNSISAQNFPEISMPPSKETHRILNIHKNVAGVLRDINNILSRYNISGQSLRTRGPIGYLVADIDSEVSLEAMEEVKRLPASIKTRILY